MDAKTHFAKSHGHWQQMAECAKAAGLDDMAKVCNDRATHYKAAHSDVVAAASKAAAADLEKSRNALEPSRVSGVVPDNPTLRAIPRFGQRQIAKTDIDPEFADLVKVDTNEE
jgi:hypothetical protein